MNYTRFLQITQNFWNEYFSSVQKKDTQGLYVKDGKIILFPKILLITETKEHFVAELIGASETFEGFSVKGHKEHSINRYLFQFNSENLNPLLGFDGKNIHVSGICFSQESDLKKIQLRFPFINNLDTILHAYPNRYGSMFVFTDNSNLVRFDNCLLVNSYQNAIRVKHILFLIVIKKNTVASEYGQWLKEVLYNSNEVKGVHVAEPGKGRIMALASQFASTYLFYGLRETTIGEFLKLHPEVIQTALGTRKFIYEPYLIWEEDEQKEPINPDLFIERDDGFYDIYDLKTALLDKSNITKGNRNRRRFKDCVNEGIAQLAHYEEYFKYQANHEYALKKYGIKVSNPNLVLVVGNFDNANREEIEEASRALKNVAIVDYDSLLQMFLSAH